VHNPDAAKFLNSCEICKVDITGDFCYRAEQQPNYHICDDCVNKYKELGYMPRLPCAGGLRRVNTSQPVQVLTEQQRRDRQLQIKRHMALLNHASMCRPEAKCVDPNCVKMKNLLKHGGECTIRVQGGCQVCRRIWALLQIHARQCRNPTCSVPKCRVLKEKMRMLMQQQQQMDDRRRDAMNASYNRG